MLQRTIVDCYEEPGRNTWSLTHILRVPHICVGELNQPWLGLWLVACLAPNHSLIQCWLIVNWTLRNKLQWNVKRNTKVSIHENAFENAVCKLASIFSMRISINACNRRFLSSNYLPERRIMKSYRFLIKAEKSSIFECFDCKYLNKQIYMESITG